MVPGLAFGERGRVIASPFSIDQNLIVTGYIGPEQLQIVRAVAERLRLPFVDFEARLEVIAEMPSSELRALFGESRLKTLEAEVVGEMLLYRGAVIHISGQTLTAADHYDRLRATGPIICLVATLDAVLQRLHLALGARYHNPRERELALGIVRREWALRARPDILELNTTSMDAEAMVEAIVACWREQAAVIDWRVV
jgi:shikimate kinase